MSHSILIGWRVKAQGAADTFELRQAAEQCCRLLRQAKVTAKLYRVTELSGVEACKEVKLRRQAPTKARRA